MYLGADDGLDALLAACTVELEGSVHVPVVGHCGRGHARLGHMRHQATDLVGAVEKAVVSVQVQVRV